MTTAAMAVAGVVIGWLAGRLLVPVLLRMEVRDSRSLRVLVPMLSAASLGTAGGFMGTTWDVLPVWVLYVSLVGVATVDLFLYRVPNAIVFPAIAVLLSLIVTISLLQDRPGEIGQAGVGAGTYWLVMFMLYSASRGSLGLGDVKLSLPMGLVLGWLGSNYGDSLLAVMFGFGLGSAFGLIMGVLVWGIRVWGNEVLPDPMADSFQSKQTTFPFAPSLATGAAVICLLIA